MATSNGPSLDGFLRCNHCNEIFPAPGALLVGAGSAHDQRIEHFLKQVVGHLEKKHPKVEQALQLGAMGYLGMLRLANFTITDQELARQRDFMRWAVHQQTLNAQIADDKLAAKAQEIAVRILDTAMATLFAGVSVPYSAERTREPLKQAIAQIVGEVLREVREQLQEPDRYRPVAPTISA